MRKNKHITSPLRAAAEALLAHSPAVAETRSAADLLHELRVHQIELEMQNEELRGALVALEESRDRYVDLYEFSPLGYLTLNSRGMIAAANLTAATLLGVERKKLLNRRFAGFMLADARESWYRHYGKLSPLNKSRSCELALQHQNNTHFYAQLDCLYMQDGETSTVRIALSDIGERKRAELEMRIAAITFESNEGMLVTDAKGVILRVNRAFSVLTGYSESEAVGNTPAMLKSGRQDKDFYGKMWGELKRNRFWQGEMWNKRKNGKIYAELLNISAVVNPEGQTTHYVGTFFEITRNKEAEAEIHRLAYYDPLTQLPNRRLLYDRLGQAIAASVRNSQYGAVLFLDIDNFKALNDTMGHDAGDLLLVAVTHRLQQAVRENDTIARLGGDEFVILLEALSKDALEAAIQVGTVGEKVREFIARPYLLKGVEFSCTTSIGVSLFCCRNNSIDDLLKHADLAMYQAKKDGRNIVRFFDPAMQTTLDEHHALEKFLRQALAREELRLYFQIQVNRMRRIIGVEALVRWQHPEQGLFSPDQFIPLAEETGLIVPIGLWVLQTACAQLKLWAAHPSTSELQLAINVSARQFRQPDFVEHVVQILADTAVNPALLKIELTESLVLDNIGDTVSKMHALKALGICLSIDDFGTGYSSLAYLKQLPLDQLKIDQSFVRNLSTNSSDAAIVKAIITLGQAFGLHVIAEGVENDEQHCFLDQHGCHAFQGYLFGKPIPIGELDRLLLVA